MPSGVYVRALNRDGKTVTVDAMELDEESFRRFILLHVAKAGILTAVVDDMEAAKREPLYTRR